MKLISVGPMLLFCGALIGEAQTPATNLQARMLRALRMSRLESLTY